MENLMVRFGLVLVAICLLLGPARARAQATAAPVVALVDGTVVAIDGGPAIQNAVVLIEGDRISKVGAAAASSVCRPAPKSFQ